MERFSVESCVRGYHVYKDIRTASVGEELPCQRAFAREAAHARTRKNIRDERHPAAAIRYVVSYLCTLCIKGARFVFASSRNDWISVIMIS